MTTRKMYAKGFSALALASLALFLCSSAILRAQRDPAEPPAAKPAPKLLPRPAAAIAPTSVNQSGMRSLIEQLVACGTRNSLASWTDA